MNKACNVSKDGENLNFRFQEFFQIVRIMGENVEESEREKKKKERNIENIFLNTKKIRGRWEKAAEDELGRWWEKKFNAKNDVRKEM